MAPTIAFDVRHLTAHRCIASECLPLQPVSSLLSVLIDFLSTAHLVVVTSARCAPARITEIGENGVAYTDKTACLRLSCLSVHFGARGVQQTGLSCFARAVSRSDKRKSIHWASGSPRGGPRSFLEKAIYCVQRLTCLN